MKRQLIPVILSGFVVLSCSESQPTAVVTESFEQPPVGVATQATAQKNKAIAERLVLNDRADFENAQRGFLARLETDAIRSDKGEVIWSLDQLDFLNTQAPDTVNPSLWRQSQLVTQHGIYKVTEGIWQVRGYDLSVMTVIEGKTGWIIVDTLTTVETARAALKLVNDTLGARPISALLYTHSHVDHFGGAKGVLSEEDQVRRNVPIIAPKGFSEHAVAENVIAGNLMARRAALMFGNRLTQNQHGHVSSGLGPGVPQGTVSLLMPTEELQSQIEARMIDGVEFEFMDAAGTEAPAEFMFYLPQKRALCTSEVATGTMHNVLTSRGAKVRDALSWSKVIDKALIRYGDKSDVVFASHHWPSWGTKNVQQHLQAQRNIYRYIHDQTMRHANAGASMSEAAEMIAEPYLSTSNFATRGYYGTLNHNAKAVYQYYFGWWSGVPAEYNELPRVQAAPRYVEAMGGAENALEIGRQAFEAGDYRWAAEVFNHIVFADDKNKLAREWLASTYEQMGFQAESGSWRSYYLSAALELREPLPTGPNAQLQNEDFLKNVPTLDLFDALASRFNPEKFNRDPFTLNLIFTDTSEKLSIEVSKDVAVPRIGHSDDSIATMEMTRQVFNQLLLGRVDLKMQLLNGNVKISGALTAPRAFFNALDQPDFWFPVVSP